MGILKSPHGGTFSEGISNFVFHENLDFSGKCPNCESDYDGFVCNVCGDGYYANKKIIQIIEDDVELEENTMTADEIALEKAFVKESRGKERRSW